MQNKSEQSTTFEVLADTSMMQCIEKLKEENEYLRKALQTAESLIKNYQQENNRLEIQVRIMECKLRKSDNIAKQHRVISERKEKFKERDSTLSQNCEREHGLVEQLNQKIKKLMVAQERYEEKISQMEHKIVLLQRNTQDKKINKQLFSVNIGVQQYQANVASAHENQKNKSKNLTELRALHMKLKNKEGQSERGSQKGLHGKGLVQRVFSKQKIQSHLSTSSSRKGINEMRKKH